MVTEGIEAGVWAMAWHAESIPKPCRKCKIADCWREYSSRKIIGSDDSPT